MERISKRNYLILILSTLILLIFVFFAAIFIGKYVIKPECFFDALFNSSTQFTTERSVILNLRLPRTIIALLTGIGLSVSGLIYQDIFQNKLVSPDFLGVSSGASIGACVAILLGLGSVWICAFSFIFAIIAMVLTLIVSKIFKNTSPVVLLLSGIIVSEMMDSGIGLIKYLADTDNQLGEITNWLLGTFSKTTMNDVYVMAPIVIIIVSIIFVIRWRINVIALGRNEANSRGLNYKLYLIVLIILITLLTASSVAFCGIVGWVGLVIPHISRLIVGRNTQRSIPFTCILGGLFMIICDILSRSFTFSEIPLSVVTGFLGTPIFVIVLATKGRGIHD